MMRKGFKEKAELNGGRSYLRTRRPGIALRTGLGASALLSMVQDSKQKGWVGKASDHI